MQQIKYMFLIFALCIYVSVTADASDIPETEDIYGSLMAIDYLSDGILPSAYQFGYVYTDDDEDPVLDTGLLTESRSSAEGQSSLPGAFIRILPHASLFPYGKKDTEYTFFTDDFHYNDSYGSEGAEEASEDTQTEITCYKQLRTDAPVSSVTGRPYLNRWRGVVYTGGIKKAVRNTDGTLTGTVLQNGEDGLFTVRYKDAVVDSSNKMFDMVITVTKITFVSDTDITGALQIMEGYRLFAAPVLCDDDGTYTILPGSSPSKDDPEGNAGDIAIGARYELTYRIENENGEPAKGFLLYTAEGLDTPGAFSTLTGDGQQSGQSDNDAFRNEQGADKYAWAEGVGIVSGAAGCAVIPGFAPQLHISRMPGTQPDGTANGLMFSADPAESSEETARDKEDTYDTSFAVMLYPAGSLAATISSVSRSCEGVPVFSVGLLDKVLISFNREDGNVTTSLPSLSLGGRLKEVSNHMIGVADGTTLDYAIRPEKGKEISKIIIDNHSVKYQDLEWEMQLDGTETAEESFRDRYGRHRANITYTLQRETDGTVHVVFQDITDNHSLKVKFSDIKKLNLPHIELRRRMLPLAAAAFCLLFFAAIVRWMRH